MPKKLMHHLDKFAIAYLDGESNEHWLETHASKEKADYYCQIVNAHEIDNGRAPKFYVALLTTDN